MKFIGGICPVGIPLFELGSDHAPTCFIMLTVKDGAACICIACVYCTKVLICSARVIKKVFLKLLLDRDDTLWWSSSHRRLDHLGGSRASTNHRLTWRHDVHLQQYLQSFQNAFQPGWCWLYRKVLLVRCHSLPEWSLVAKVIKMLSIISQKSTKNSRTSN